MIGNRLSVLTAAAAVLCVSIVPAAAQSRFDGAWTLTAVTTSGHCGVIPVTMEIVRGRIHATGGSYAFIPISLGGRISASGGAIIKAVTGPRIAQGTGHFSYFAGKGRWHGTGPSGFCSGTWTATRG